MCSVSFKLVYLWNYHEVSTHFFKKSLKIPQTNNKEQKAANLHFSPLPFFQGNLPDNKLPLNVNKTKVT